MDCKALNAYLYSPLDLQESSPGNRSKAGEIHSSM